MILHFPRQHYGDFAIKEGCRKNERKDRPEWMRKLPKPSGVIGYSPDQVGCFLWSWSIRTHYADQFYCFALDNGQAEGLTDRLTRGSVLFVLPFGGWLAETEMMKGIREHADRRGIVTIRVPMKHARGEHWPIEESMCISTRIQMAKKSKRLLLDAT